MVHGQAYECVKSWIANIATWFKRGKLYRKLYRNNLLAAKESLR